MERERYEFDYSKQQLCGRSGVHRVCNAKRNVAMRAKRHGQIVATKRDVMNVGLRKSPVMVNAILVRARRNVGNGRRANDARVRNGNPAIVFGRHAL